MDSVVLSLRDLRRQWIFRDCSQSESGEYYPTSSWSGDLMLRDSDDCSLRVQVHVRASPSWRRTGSYAFGIRLRFGTHEEEVESGVCGSVKTAALRAGATDYAEALARLYRRVYGEASTCVFRKDGDAWHPFASLLHGWGYCWQDFEVGDYLVVHRNPWDGNRIGGSLHRICGSGCGGYHDPEWAALARSLPHWMAEQKEAA